MTCTDVAPVICWSLTTTPATNGTTGCLTGTKYTGAISITAPSNTLQVIAGGTGYTDSSVTTYTYTIGSTGWPIKASGRFLVTQAGTAWPMLCSSPQPMIAFLTPTQMGNYMSDRASYGFNCLWFEILLGTYDGGNSDGSLLDGTVPFTSPNPGTENNYDLSTPNNAYWTEIDNIVTQAASYGLVVLLDPWDTGLSPSTGVCSTTGQTGWLITARTNGNTKMYNFGAYLGNRYKNFSNVIWVLGDDFQTQACTTGAAANDSTLVAQFMAGLESADPNHLVSLELNYNFSYTTQNATVRPYSTMNGVYTYGGIYDEFLQAWNASTVPTFLVESNYEYKNNTGGNTSGNGMTWPGVPTCGTVPANNTAYDYIPRLEAWWSFTSGAVGEIYSNFWEESCNFAGPWVQGIDSLGASQIQYISSFLANIPWTTMVPDQTHTVVTAGYGTYNASGLNMLGNNYATTVWNPAGNLAVVYDPYGNNLTVNLAVFNAHVGATWYDPTNGNYVAITGSPFNNSGSHVFSTPGNNSRGVADWVLLLQAIPTNPVAATPICTPGGGFYTTTQLVTCTDASPGAVMCYTLGPSTIVTPTPATDGASGCSVGTKYTTQLSIILSQTLKVVGGGTGYTDSSAAQNGYAFPPPAVSNHPNLLW